MSLHVTNPAEFAEAVSILADACREGGRAILRVIVSPALAFARYVDRCDE